MDDMGYQKIQQYVQALKALQRSVERSLQEDTYEGTGRMAVKSYQGIQRKIAEIFPEDFYVTDTLSLEVSGEVQERHMLSQVQLAASQLIIYLDGLMRDYRRTTGVATPDLSDLRTLGRDLQEQILTITKATIRNALSGIDIDVEGGPKLAGANLEGANLENENYSGRNLKYANLRGAKIRGANFSGSNLREANLEGVDAEGANFSGANLKDTHLQGASFVNANLTGANLKDANLEGANLTGAQISGSNFSGANMQGATMPNGQPFRDERDFQTFNATARRSSIGGAHVRIEIGDDEEEKQKPKNDDPIV
jgi:uncharacterized protein YjbI with pentapeptide repeats